MYKLVTKWCVLTRIHFLFLINLRFQHIQLLEIICLELLGTIIRSGWQIWKAEAKFFNLFLRKQKKTEWHDETNSSGAKHGFLLWVFSSLAQAPKVSFHSVAWEMLYQALCIASFPPLATTKEKKVIGKRISITNKLPNLI